MRSPVCVPWVSRSRRVSCSSVRSCDRVADGSITLSYRLWKRPRGKAGARYRGGDVVIEIDDVELLPFSSITTEDLRLAGESDVETLRLRTAHAGPVHDDTLVYRIEFHVAGED